MPRKHSDIFDTSGWPYEPSPQEFLRQVYEQEEYGESILESLPGYAKVLLLLQPTIILFLSFWIYEEYGSNPYLRSYVNDNLQGFSLTLLLLIAIGSFVIVAAILYAKLRGYRRELEGIASTGKFGHDGDGVAERSIQRLKNFLSRLSGKLPRSS